MTWGTSRIMVGMNLLNMSVGISAGHMQIDSSLDSSQSRLYAVISTSTFLVPSVLHSRYWINAISLFHRASWMFRLPRIKGFFLSEWRSWLLRALLSRQELTKGSFLLWINENLSLNACKQRLLGLCQGCLRITSCIREKIECGSFLVNDSILWQFSGYTLCYCDLTDFWGRPRTMAEREFIVICFGITPGYILMIWRKFFSKFFSIFL